MQALLLLGPLTAQVWFGRPSIWTLPPMQRTTNPVVVQKGASGDDLGFDREITGSLDLAEIRRAPGTHQGFESSLPPGAHDLNLEIAAAGRSPGMVGGPARRQGTGVGPGQDGKGTPGRLKGSNRHFPILDDHESVLSHPSGLLFSPGPAGSRTREAVSLAPAGGAIPVEITAGDVEHGVHVQLAFIFPDFVKCDVLGVPDQPGGFMIQGSVPFFQRTNPKNDGDTATLGAERLAGRGDEPFAGRERLNSRFHALN
jgi:hypothetical protein